MNLSKKPKQLSEVATSKHFKCTLDGVNWTFSDKKKFRYCIPANKEE